MLRLAGLHLTLGSMAIMKRLSIAVLAFAFIVALTAQAVLPALATPLMSHAASMNPGGMPTLNGRPVAPCKQTTPLCVEHAGCVLAVATLGSPIATGVPIRWRAVTYDLAEPHLAGRAVARELSPPIVAT